MGGHWCEHAGGVVKRGEAIGMNCIMCTDVVRQGAAVGMACMIMYDWCGGCGAV